MLRIDLDKVEDIFRESLVLAWDLRLDGLVQHALEGFACVAGAHGEAQRAARLWGAGPSPAPGEGRPQA